MSYFKKIALIVFAVLVAAWWRRRTKPTRLLIEVGIPRPKE
jgi:hypothetical protein